MKCTMALTAVAALSLAACETLNRPITSGDYDPLRPPGSTTGPRVSTGPVFSAGQFVRATMDNTAFFKNRPNGDADADKLLKRATSMKVISNSGSYLKVELDTGEVGFVPSVMVEDPKAAQNPAMTAPGEFQVYPPLNTGVGEPLPVIDPAGLPPEGAIPTVIDPDAPAVHTPVPPVAPMKDQFATPVPPVESKPLPPNGEELDALKKSKEAVPNVEGAPKAGQ
ncbi:MAG: hypothetical protein ABI600_02700 [Luteolibacter sp.]